jgi:hypothetical protein
MEQQQRSLIFTAAVGLIILAIIVGSIYYLVKFIQGRVASNNQAPQPSVTEIAEDFAAPGSTDQAPLINTATPSAQTQVPQTGGTQNRNAQAPDKKFYDGTEFQLTYPKNWGLLKCSNSKNVEFDTSGPADSDIVCDIATKPVTVVVGDVNGCEGETVKLGNVNVVKAQETQNGDIYYQWCTKTTPVLNITHRVSQQNKRGFSPQDFSKQVEEIISNLSFTRGS